MAKALQRSLGRALACNCAGGLLAGIQGPMRIGIARFSLQLRERIIRLLALRQATTAKDAHVV